LWLSNSARYESGSAIRGGIPLCWPWFGAFADDTKMPQHGFARTSMFEVVATDADDTQARIVLRKIGPSPAPLRQDNLHLEFELRLSDSLWMEIRSINRGPSTVAVGAALHSYFAVTDTRNVRIDELTGLAFKDKTQGFAQRLQAKDLVVSGEVDRIYLNPPARITLRETDSKRRIAIDAWGHTDLVVWNPGPEVAMAMSDFDSERYASMICIEPANALDNVSQLASGQQHRLGQNIRCEITQESMPCAR
jgi:D-hexose-6-phosphate mutarotase